MCLSPSVTQTLAVRRNNDAILPRLPDTPRPTQFASGRCTMSKNPNASNPSAFLKNVLGRPVVVKLNSGVDYRGAPRLPPHDGVAPGRHRTRCTRIAPPRRARALGVLACLDGFMNIAMEQTEEYVNGQLKAKYGDAFIRGNNGARNARRCNAPHILRRTL